MGQGAPLQDFFQYRHLHSMAKEDVWFLLEEIIHCL